MTENQHNTPLQLNTSSDILVHYYPGNNSAPTQATRYIGEKDEIKLPTGERAKTKKTGIPLFESRHFYFPGIEEIEINKGSHFFAKILHWFKSIPSFIKHWWSGIEIVHGDKSSDNNNSYNGFVVNSNKSSLGQQTDIREFAKSNEEIEQSPELSHKPRIYFGVSRGAAATFSALAEVQISQNIKLCVLEAPPSSLSGLFKYWPSAPELTP